MNNIQQLKDKFNRYVVKLRVMTDTATGWQHAVNTHTPTTSNVCHVCEKEFPCATVLAWVQYVELLDDEQKRAV